MSSTPILQVRGAGHLFLRLLLFFIAGSAFSQGQLPADLLLEAVLNPANAVTPPGSSGTLTITVTNLGPDPLAGHSPGSFFLSVFGNGHSVGPIGRPIEYFKIGGDPNCLMTVGNVDPEPGMLPEVVFSLAIVGGLAIDESSTCELEFHINPLATQDILSSWFAFSFAEDDPDDSNNLVQFHLRISSPSEIPTLSTAALVLTALLLAIAGVTIRSRRSQKRC